MTSETPVCWAGLCGNDIVSTDTGANRQWNPVDQYKPLQARSSTLAELDCKGHLGNGNVPRRE